MRRAALLLAVLMILAGCGPKKAEPDTSAPPPPPPVETAAPSQPKEPEAPAPPTPAPPAISDEKLTQLIAYFLKRKGVAVDAGGPRLFPLQLSQVPAGHTRMVAVANNMKFYLFAITADGSPALFGQMDDAMVNMAKLEISGKGDRIHIWSQAPFRASELRVELSWNGSQLQEVGRKVADPTEAYFVARQKLIDQKDIDGLMTMGGSGKDILYPQSSGLYWSQPKKVLLLAYEKSLERYRAGELARALKTLSYGVSSYSAVYGGLLEPTQPGPGQSIENLLPVNERVPIANDLAFFLAESGRHSEALPLLKQVIEIAPDRAVAYLNLADVEWELGQKAEAKVHYQRYLELLGPDKVQAPERVSTRLNS
ncbi:MAG: tetratricopeptide repeat protein [Bacillota bacterium]